MELEIQSGPDLILIEPDEAKRDSDSAIVMSDIEKKNLERQQNRGKIIYIGKEVKFWEIGDYVSFYRNAATPITEAGKEYLTIHQGHVLVRFKEKSVK